MTKLSPPWSPDTLLLDVDGTLVDSNYHHALAWYRAFRRHGLTLNVWTIHRHMGMGGDRLVPSLAGEEFDRDHGDDVRRAWETEFDGFLDEVAMVAGATALLQALRDTGRRVVLASSGKPKHVEAFVDLLSARDLVDGWTTSEDVSDTKPAPELLEVALRRFGGESGLTIGDSTWDCVAAQRIGMPALAVRTGGFSVDELCEAGAAEVFDSLDELRAAAPRLLG